VQASNENKRIQAHSLALSGTEETLSAFKVLTNLVNKMNI